MSQLHGSNLFFALLVMHALCDYPLQADFLARAKNHTAPVPGIDPGIALWMHALIHAGGVWLITGSPTLGAVEFMLHTAIDYAKCAGLTSFRTDQALHVACKLLYTLA